MTEKLKGVQDVEDTYERLYKVDECSVCMNDLTSDLVTFATCGHIFHTQCAKDSLEANPMCPDCRAETSEADIKPLQFNIDNKENDDLWQDYKERKRTFDKVKGTCDRFQNQNKILEEKCEEMDLKYKDLEGKNSDLQKKFHDHEKIWDEVEIGFKNEIEQQKKDKFNLKVVLGSMVTSAILYWFFIIKSTENYGSQQNII